ncbi:MAG: hypothetical protein AMXMBFR84_13940 [Candidatus Hydrogenedentota bacterium]
MSINRELNLEMPLQDIRHEAVLNIVRTAAVMSNTGALLFRRFGLTEAQFNVLFSLKFNPTKVTQSDLGKRLVVTRASITSVLDKLESKGLVERKDVSGDRRMNHVRLTEAGKRLVDEVEPFYRENLKAVTKGLSDQDCAALIRLLEQVRDRTWELQDSLSETGSKTQERV